MTYITRRNQLRQARLSARLAEYQIGTTRADFHTQLIWTWATAILGINAAGVGLLAHADKYSEGRFLLVSLLAAAASFLVWWWNLASDRWHVIIRTMYVRLHEIESDQGMRLHRSIDLRDRPTLPQDHPEAAIQTRIRGETGYPNTGSIGLKALRTHLRYGVPIIWSFVLFSESVAFLTAGRPCLLLLPSTNCRPLDLCSHLAVVPLWVLSLVPMGTTALLLNYVVRKSRDKYAT